MSSINKQESEDHVGLHKGGPRKDQSGIDVNIKLYRASKNGDEASVRRLLKEGAVDVNWGNPKKSGRTALHVASSRGWVTIVRLLIDHGADPWKLSQSGNTPLDLACLSADAANQASKSQICDMLKKSPSSAGSGSPAGSAVTASSPIDADLIDSSSLFTHAVLADKDGGDKDVQESTTQPTPWQQRLQDAVHPSNAPMEPKVELPPPADFSTAPEASGPVKKENDPRTAALNTPLDAYGRTALILAVTEFNAEGVKLLINAGAGLDVKSNSGKTALIWAAKQGKLDTAKLLVDAGAELNVQDDNGFSALLHASMYGFADVAQLLVDAGASVNLQSNDGNTALIAASRYGSIELAKLLIVAGAAVDLQKKDGRSALIVASRHGTFGIAKILIEAGASLDLKDKSGCTAFTWASRLGYTDVSQLLIDSGASVDPKEEEGRTGEMEPSVSQSGSVSERVESLSVDFAPPLMSVGSTAASAMGQEELVLQPTPVTSVAPRDDPVEEGEQPWISMGLTKGLWMRQLNLMREVVLATLYRDLLFAESLSLTRKKEQLRANINSLAPGRTDFPSVVDVEMRCFSLFDDLEVRMKTLYQEGDVRTADACGDSLAVLRIQLSDLLQQRSSSTSSVEDVERSSFSQHVKPQQELVWEENIPNIEKSNQSRDKNRSKQLWEAAKRGDITQVQRLLEEKKADVNWQNPDIVGETALHCAVKFGRTTIVQLCVEAGADVNCQNEVGDTPLHLAAQHGNTAMIQLFLEMGADPNTSNKGGETALHYASRFGRVAVVQLLVEATGDINKQDKGGDTPLLQASQYGHSAVVQLLLEFGADPSKETITALDVVCRGYGASPSHAEMIRDLLTQANEFYSHGSAAQKKDDDDPKIQLYRAYSLRIGRGVPQDVLRSIECFKAAFDTCSTNSIADLVILQEQIEAETTSIPVATLSTSSAPSDISLSATSTFHENQEKKSTDRSADAAEGFVMVSKPPSPDPSHPEHSNTCGQTKSEEVSRELYIAAKVGNELLVRFILCSGCADINWHNPQEINWTALIVSSCNGYLSIVQLLLRAGAKRDVHGSDKRTALMWAAIQGQAETVNCLILARAEVDIIARDGSTALICASRRGHIEVVRSLVAARAGLSFVDRYGHTALTAAEAYGHPAVASFLSCRV